MKIQLDRESRIPLYIQIINQIKAMIFSGALPPEYLLPPERKLAEELEVNRSTILNAYRELKAEGLVHSRIGKGTMVVPYESKTQVSIRPPEHRLTWQYLLSDEACRFNDIRIIEMLRVNGDQPIISFATGMADPALYPVDEFYPDITYDIVKKKRALGHTLVEGCVELRKTIMKMQKEKGIDSLLEELLILSGSQQGLNLVARCLLNAGDTVIVQEPTYIGALQIFSNAGVKIISVPVEEKGMRLDIMETLIKKHKPKLIYVIPTFQNPTGTTMDLKSRIKLLNIAYSNQVPIIEDDAYGELRYEGNTFPSLKALDQYDHVLYLNTFSKTLFPGIRIGWMCGPKEIIHQLTVKKQLEDLHTSTFSQVFLTEFLKSGRFQVHIDESCRYYREKRDTMLKKLENSRIKGLRWVRPSGGLYIWCGLPLNISADTLLLKSKEKGVIFVPGSAFFLNNKGNEYIRLNFTYPTVKEIEKGMMILLNVIEEENKKNQEKIINKDSAICNPIY